MLKDIKGYEGLYQISSEDGTVINLKTGKIISPWITNKGYLCVDLVDANGVRKHMLLHRAMAYTFIENPYNHPIVLHLDNNKLNISPDNLKWGTYSENNAQAIRDGINTIPRPDNRKDYIISDGHDAYTPFYYHGISEVLDEIEYGNESTGYGIVRRHSEIKEGPYKGYYVEKYNR